MTPQQIASILERVLPLVLANAPEVNKLAAIRLEVQAMKRCLENIERLLADDDPTPPAAEEIKPAAVEIAPAEPVVTPAPASIEAAAQNEAEKKAGKWAKFTGVLKKILPVASVALIAGVPGGAAIAAGVNALVGPGTADPLTAGVTGILVPVTAAIVKGMEKPKE